MMGMGHFGGPFELRLTLCALGVYRKRALTAITEDTAEELFEIKE